MISCEQMMRLKNKITGSKGERGIKVKKIISAVLMLALLVAVGVSASADEWNPDITFTTVDTEGKEWTDRCFADAELTMINLWAYWCPPCVGELPDLQKLSEDYAARGFQLLGISPEEYEQNNMDTMQKLGVTYPCLRLTQSVDQEMNTGYIPTTVFVNQEGKIVGDVYVGSKSYEQWASIIEKNLGGTDFSMFLKEYAPVLDTYRMFFNGSEPESMDTTERGDYYCLLGETGISEMSRNGGEIGCCLKDLDGNGVPELLIGATGAEYYDEALIYDMFTLENGVPVRVLVSSARVRYYLAEEDLILHEGSGGAAYNLSLLYYLQGSELELATGIVMADAECYKVYEDRESLFSERKPSDQNITREEYFDLMEKMEGLTVPMELVPF